LKLSEQNYTFLITRRIYTYIMFVDHTIIAGIRALSRNWWTSRVSSKIIATARISGVKGFIITRDA
jgi:hypothetical protein